MSSSTSTSISPSTQDKPQVVEAYETTATVQKKFERWRRSLKYITGIGLTPVEKAEHEAYIAEDMQRKQCGLCEKRRDKLLKWSPAVIFMRENLEKAGCKISTQHIKCAPCDELRSGGFSPDHGIILCQNRFFSKAHQEDTLIHEMIHMYDHCRFKIDWNNCWHHACSEVRAASLSGDCRWSREIRRGFFTFSKQHQVCVKRRAILSVKHNTSCSAPGIAEKVVEDVFESCFNDTQPFDEIY
ncbi:8878_t:CDS:2 [Ambispora leptoticha]|uniref:Mitochondrial inner membrane protease ATP23 n=1 Tax=Ambispora leptoticha TaxID=144679 RepID=A0A9N9GCU0_9GLOM|nr:8878_t:CDS:2 [Ambispora leptoticha]